jgi:putative glutamine amidotransferase
LGPVIGVTATLREDKETSADRRPLGTFVRADLDYVSGVEQAGGIPVVLPPLAGDPRTAARAMVRGLDGLLLSGGTDLHPEAYGEEPHPALAQTIPERDAFELEIFSLALELGLPVFGICRGMQLMNVALGGTLYQDLPAQFGRGEVDHSQTAPKWVPRHGVEVESGSRVGIFSGVEYMEVNSYHHQAVKRLAEGLAVVGRSEDGVVEALESRDFSERWLVGVQWHAEAMRGSSESGVSQRALFEAHVEAARQGAGRRAVA